MRRRRPDRQNQHTRWRPSKLAPKNIEVPTHLNSPRDNRLVALEVGLIHRERAGLVAIDVPYHGSRQDALDDGRVQRGLLTERRPNPMEGLRVVHPERRQRNRSRDGGHGSFVTLELGYPMVAVKILEESVP